MTENAAIVNTHFLPNPSASSAFTGNSLKMLCGRMEPGSRAFLRHGPAEGAAIFVGTAEPAPFCNRLRTRGQRICGGFAAGLRRVCGGFAAAFRWLFRCRRPQLQRRNGPDDAEKSAAQPAAGGHAGTVHPAGRRRACRRARQRAGYPNTRIRGRPWSSGRSARRPERASLRRLQCARGQCARGQFARAMKNDRAACPVS